MASLQARAPAVVRRSSLRALKHPTVPPPSVWPHGSPCQWQASHSRLFQTLIQPPEQPLPAAPSYCGRKRPLYIQHAASICLQHSQMPSLTRSFSSAEAVSSPLPSVDEAFNCRVNEEAPCSAEASNASEAATHRSSEAVAHNNLEVTTLSNLEVATDGYVEAATHVEGREVTLERAKDDTLVSMDNAALRSLLTSLQQSVDDQSKAIAVLQDEVQEMKRSLRLLPPKLDPSKVSASSFASVESIREVTESIAEVDEPAEIKSEGSKILKDWSSFLDHLKALKSFKELQGVGKDGHDVFQDLTTLKRTLAKFSQVYDTIFDSLSREDLQGLAQYGCPSDDPRTVASGKRLRGYLQVKEKQVCEPCIMQSSCESAFVKPTTTQARLADVMRLLYKTFEISLPREKGNLPEGVASSIQRLLKDLTSLSLKHDITSPVQDSSVSNSMNSASSAALKHTGNKVHESLGRSVSNPGKATKVEVASDLSSTDRVCVGNITLEKPERDSAGLGSILQEKNEREDTASTQEVRADKRAVSLTIEDQSASDMLREEGFPSDKESKQPSMDKSKGKGKSKPTLDGLEDDLEDVVDADEDDDSELDQLTDESDEDESMVDDDELESDEDESIGDDSELESSKEDEHTKLFDDLVKKDATTETGKKGAKKHLDLPQQLSASESQKEFARKTPLSELVSLNANAFRPRKEQYQGIDDSRGDGRMTRGRGYGNNQYNSNSRRMPDRDGNDEEEASSNEFSSRRINRERGGDASFRGGYRSESRGSSSDYGGGQGRRGFQDRSSDYRSGRADTGARGRSYGEGQRWTDGGERSRGFGRSIAEDESDQDDYRSERGRGGGRGRGRGRPRGFESEQQEYRSDRRDGGRGRPRF